MAFVSRKKQEEKIINNKEKSKTIPNKEEIQENLKNQVSVKTYLEMTIETLNILEKNGIDIYDKNRFGGMYHTKSNKKNFKINSLKSKLINNKDESKTSEKTETEQISNLINFFKK